MVKETNIAQEADLDRTDQLPVLDVAAYEAALKDGSDTASQPALLSADMTGGFARPAGLDLPSLAETVRSVEARIARQNTEHEILTREFERVRDAEAAAVARANALAADLAALRTSLEAEQARAHDLDKTLAERNAAAEFAKSRTEEALRDAQRVQEEGKTLRESLAARDANIVQMLQSLSERDTQLQTLQREHTQLLPQLEARTKTGAQLTADLESARAQAKALGEEVAASKQAVAAMTTQMALSDAQLSGLRTELAAARALAATYLEKLQTRDWRQEFSQNLFRETDSALGAAVANLNALQSERNQLQGQVSTLTARVEGQSETIASLKGTITANAEKIKTLTTEAEAREREHAEALERIARERAEEKAQSESLRTAEIERMSNEHLAERARLASERAEEKARLEDSLAEEKARNDIAFKEERERTTRERAEELAEQGRLLIAERERREREHAELKESTDRAISELTTQFMGLKAEHGNANRTLAANDEELTTLRDAVARETLKNSENSSEIRRLQTEYDASRKEITSLMAQLKEARRPTNKIEAEVRRLTEELAAKTAKFDALEDESRNLSESLQRARGALEEREFLIRRLERSEANNANVLGRIQTTIERLGTLPNGGMLTGGGTNPALASPSQSAAEGGAGQGELEWIAELIRVDGGNSVSYVLSRRTRVGRATGCELRIDSSSVSRQHAMITMGPRDIVIEDLNSTNGVFVNGRKIARQTLNDGDVLTIGEAQFRFAAKPLPA